MVAALVQLSVQAASEKSSYYTREKIDFEERASFGHSLAGWFCSWFSVLVKLIGSHSNNTEFILFSSSSLLPLLPLFTLCTTTKNQKVYASHSSLRMSKSTRTSGNFVWSLSPSLLLLFYSILRLLPIIIHVYEKCMKQTLFALLVRSSVRYLVVINILADIRWARIQTKSVVSYFWWNK